MSQGQGDTKAKLLEPIKKPVTATPPNSARVVLGKTIPPQQQILLYSAADWELFIEEWLTALPYDNYARFSGAGDMGVDVAGFCTNSGLKGDWDNYQCKHYEAPLTPGVAIPEIAKMLWHVFSGNISCPRRYYFMAPKDCGASLKRLLLDTDKILPSLKEKWERSCSDKITSTQTVALDGEFAKFVESFDFSIFGYKPTLEAINEHRMTPFFVARFGGGLPDRPAPDAPPVTPAHAEHRYVTQLLAAYSEKSGKAKACVKDLEGDEVISSHFNRQREYFYYAEGLRNFARDSVPPGTFEELQDEVYAGVIDVAVLDHPNGFERVNSVTQTAAALPLTANGLISVTKVQDKRGICHQLANVDRLKWCNKDD